MSYDFCIDPKVNCVFVRYVDFVRGEGVEAINRAIEHDDFRPGMNILRDTRNHELPDFLDYNWFKNDFEEIYREQHLLMQGSKFAWLVGTSADFAKAHSWSLVTRTTQGQNRMAFRNLRQSLDWLGVPADYTISFGQST